MIAGETALDTMLEWAIGTVLAVSKRQPRLEINRTVLGW